VACAFVTEVSACSGEVANGRFHSECSRAVGTTCPFTCNRGYGPVTKDPVVCQHNLHWSRSPDELCKGHTVNVLSYLFLCYLRYRQALLLLLPPRLCLHRSVLAGFSAYRYLWLLKKTWMNFREIFEETRFGTRRKIITFRLILLGSRVFSHCLTKCEISTILSSFHANSHYVY